MADTTDKKSKGIPKSNDAMVNKIIANVEDDLHAGRQAASKAINPKLYSDVTPHQDGKNKKDPKTTKP